VTGLLLRPGAVLGRNVMAYRRTWYVFLAGFVEPLLFLGSIGIGVGELVGEVTVPGVGPVPYREFVAPALVATAAMNGAVFDATFSFFFKLKYARTFSAMLATPLSPADIAVGELAWCLVRGSTYSSVFLVTMWALGLIASPWAILALPVTVLIGIAFGGVAMAATTWMRSFIDFDKVNLVLIPLFLFSATFFPLARYPDAVEGLVRVTPLYQGVHLVRSLCLGEVGPGLLVHAAYLLVMGAVGLRIASRRLDRLLQP